MSDSIVRRLPVGAEVVRGQGVHFRVWAPQRKSVEVVLAGETPRFVRLDAQEGGYHAGLVAEAVAGSLYKYKLDGGDWFPDPVSRFQPKGPHQYSQVIDPDDFCWTDSVWQGVAIAGQVIYELHIGTFTGEGTWAAAEKQLPYLAQTGITVLEVMPINEFPGTFGWGYDGVHLFAPTRLYGTPDQVRSFVNRAHALKMAVILDVVYNHFGPDGNYLPQFSPFYFTADHETDWGEAINFYAEHDEPVREFYLANARYWIQEFHMDGLRYDATQSIYDKSKEHILAALTREVREAAGGRPTILIGENEPQDVQLIQAPARGGYGLDALWNDDYHHSAMARMTGHNEAYYSDYLGRPQEFISAMKYGYLYQGQWYKWQKQRRGTSSLGFPPAAFVTFLQNHDQVANSARGQRCHQLTSPGVFKALTALTLLGPGTPMIFQGQEWAASSPFLYFADHEPDLAELVRAGRKKFLGQFRSLRMREVWHCFADPHDPETFRRSKLDHAERERPFHDEMWRLHRDLLRLRRQEAAFRAQKTHGVDGAVLSDDALLLRFFGDNGDDRLLVVNFGLDLHLDPTPEPLMAPPLDQQWNILFSTEAPAYGGCGTSPLETDQNWFIPGQAAVVLTPGKRGEVFHALTVDPSFKENETKKEQ